MRTVILIALITINALLLASCSSLISIESAKCPRRAPLRSCRSLAVVMSLRAPSFATSPVLAWPKRKCWC
jgi:hypothetical protein